MSRKLDKLDVLINKYGSPNVLIDNHKLGEKGYAIWGFRQIIEYNQTGLYIDSNPSKEDPFDLLQSLFTQWIKSKQEITAIGFLSYDIKNIIYPHIKFKKITNNLPYM